MRAAAPTVSGKCERLPAKYLLLLALPALVAGCATESSDRWRAARVAALVQPADAAREGSCGAVPSARVSFYLGGARAHAIVPLGRVPEAIAGQTAYFDSRDKCSGLRPEPPAGVRVY